MNNRPLLHVLEMATQNGTADESVYINGSVSITRLNLEGLLKMPPQNTSISHPSKQATVDAPISLTKSENSRIMSPRKSERGGSVKYPGWLRECLARDEEENVLLSERVSPRIQPCNVKKSPRNHNILKRSFTSNFGVLSQVDIERLLQAKNLYKANAERLLRLKSIEAGMQMIDLGTPYNNKIEEIFSVNTFGFDECRNLLDQTKMAEIRSKNIIKELLEQAQTIDGKMCGMEYAIYKDIYMAIKTKQIPFPKLGAIFACHPQFKHAFNFVHEGVKLNAVFSEFLRFSTSAAAQLQSVGVQRINRVATSGDDYFYIVIDADMLGNPAVAFATKRPLIIRMLEMFGKMYKLKLRECTIDEELMRYILKCPNLNYIIFANCKLTKNAIGMLNDRQFVGIKFKNCNDLSIGSGNSPHINTHKLSILGYNTFTRSFIEAFRCKKLVYQGDLGFMTCLKGLETIKLIINASQIIHLPKIDVRGLSKVKVWASSHENRSGTKVDCPSHADIKSLHEFTLKLAQQAPGLTCLELLNVWPNMDYIDDTVIYPNLVYFGCGTTIKSDFEIDEEKLLKCMPRCNYFWERGGIIVEHQLEALLRRWSAIKHIQIPEHTVLRPSKRREITNTYTAIDIIFSDV